MEIACKGGDQPAFRSQGLRTICLLLDSLCVKDVTRLR